ncbi:MAG TPA: hypothetical protein VEB64_12920 [Azospirillaceae bacterium]|nr:hypothetical protein [Azospirillaceae bacterium]
MPNKQTGTSLELPAGRRVGYALGGLGGTNGHGVGFLIAALKMRGEPNIISCTSGMIVWVWRWMELKKKVQEKYLTNAQAATELETEFRTEVERIKALRLPCSQISVTPTMFWGIPGIFRPAYFENFMNFLSVPWLCSIEEWLSRLYPSRLFIPERSEKIFEEITNAFNEWPDPVMFNSYSPRDGIEYLHMNEPARQIFERRKTQRRLVVPETLATRDLKRRQHLPTVKPASIDKEAVRDALWLTLYGFGSPHQEQERIDGAYVRQFILTEMSEADILFIPRPQGAVWQGPLPTNLFEVRDFETELWFNASYREQMARIEFINRLIANGTLATGSGYSETILAPVEIEVQRGFFTYFMEDLSVLRAAVRQSLQMFEIYCGGTAEVNIADRHASAL